VTAVHLAIVLRLVQHGAAHAEAAPLGAEECPALFGSTSVRRGNRDYRRHNLHWVQQEAAGITVAHSKDDWDTPVPLAITGLALVRTAGSKAELELSPRTAALVGCAAGRYRVMVDDGVSPNLRVLAILRGVMLLDQRGRLAFVSAPGEASPRWLMAWRVRGIVTHGSSARRPAPAPPPRPPPPPRR
jgi:hypothetical protein